MSIIIRGLFVYVCMLVDQSTNWSTNCSFSPLIFVDQMNILINELIDQMNIFVGKLMDQMNILVDELINQMTNK